MSDAVQDLVAALGMQVTLCDELRQLLTAEQEAMGSLDTARMGELNTAKEEVALRQKRTTEQLRAALDRLARQVGLPAGSTLEALLAALPKESAQVLLPLQKQVRESGTALKNLAEQNRAVLERFLGTVNESLGFLTRVLNSSNMYGANGMYRTEQAGAMIVNREV